MKHRCPIRGCSAIVPGNLLMCAAHWHFVPQSIGNAVYREYRRAPRSEAHFAAIRAAINAVESNMGPKEAA